MRNDYLERILTARVYDVAVETPLEPAPNLSRRIGSTVLLKREDLQPVFSFKLRGAYNKMVRLSAGSPRAGVVAASAGNHAQGVALAAQRLGCRATIVMPVTTPRIKVEAVAARGAKVVLFGDSYDDAYTHARRLSRRGGRTFVHPYDDPDVIAGQGTIGLEILRQKPTGDRRDLRRRRRGRPRRRDRGLREAAAAGDPGDRRRAGRRRRDAPVARGRTAGDAPERSASSPTASPCARWVRETFRLCRKLLDEVVLVDTDAICAAIKDVFEETRSILEPAGALPVAGMKAWAARERRRGQTLVAVTSGANMNFDRLRHVAERAELGERREAILAVTIPERPGSFREFCAVIGPRNVTEFNYRYADPVNAHVFVGLEVQDAGETKAILEALRKNGLPALDLTENEMAKLHVRHLVGGRAPQARNERLYRFEFPERPGALLTFLNKHARRLEHQPLPLPEPRGRLRPGPRRHPGAAPRRREFRALPRKTSATALGREREPRVPALPGLTAGPVIAAVGLLRSPHPA